MDRKDYTTQYALLKLIENWKKFRDERGYSAAVLMDLLNVFNTFKHDCLIAKLYAQGLHGTSLKLSKYYLSNRFHVIERN